MRILLVQPRSRGKLGFNNLFCLEPLALESLAANVAEHEVEIIDGAESGTLRRALSSFRPHLCGISCSFTKDAGLALEAAAIAKAARPAPFVVVGGHHASLSPADFALPQVDAVIEGEGELTFAELVACLERGDDPGQVASIFLNEPQGQRYTWPRPRVKNLDSLPLPARHLVAERRKDYYLSYEGPIALVETSRGCPYRCDFCSVWRFHEGRVRFKSPERVVAELATVAEGSVVFSDDNFFVSVPRALRIAELLQKAGLHKRFYAQARTDTIAAHPEIVSAWREVGLAAVLLGLEKIDDEGLAKVNKRNSAENNRRAVEVLRQQKVGIFGSFIVDPGWDREDFERLRHYISRGEIEAPSFTVLTPLPGTELFARWKDRLATVNCELFDLLHSVVPTKLDLVSFYEEFAALWGTAYAHSYGGWVALREGAKRLMLRRLPLRHYLRMSSAGRALADPRCYLTGHGYNVDRLPVTVPVGEAS